MKKVLILILFFLSLSSSFSQETLVEPIKSKTGILAKGYISDIPISNKLSLQNGLLFSNYGVFNQLEVPILLKHKISDKWSVLFGSQLSTIANYQLNLLGKQETGFKNLTVSMYLGTEYQISEKTIGELSLRYQVFKQESTSFETVNIDDSQLKFNLGVKF